MAAKANERRDEAMLVLPYVKPTSQTEIGKRLGLPQRKVSRIIVSATKSLKEKLVGHR